MARPVLPAGGQASADVRAFVERVVTDQLEAEPKLPPDAISAVSVQVATALAINDRLTTGKLHPVTRLALDRIGRAAGRRQLGMAFRDVPPIKIDEHYGVTMAALGVGVASRRLSPNGRRSRGAGQDSTLPDRSSGGQLASAGDARLGFVHVEQLMLPRERSAVIAKIAGGPTPRWRVVTGEASSRMLPAKSV